MPTRLPGKDHGGGTHSAARPTSETPWKFIAASPGRKGALSLAQRVADASCPVLIMGPTGIGKDVLAEDIHHHSQRRDGPFVAVNCGALSPNLFESELFGHVRGAYTSAAGPKPGLVELADRGTLFLDEVGELPPEAQVKLLRFLAKGTFWPVGATAERRADVRVLAATNRDLPSMLDGAFRADLYYRLSVVTIVVPPLDRPDVELVAKSFLSELCAENDVVLSSAEVSRLSELASRCTWRGGARELRNALERLLLLRDAGQGVDDAFRRAVEAPRRGHFDAHAPPHREGAVAAVIEDPTEVVQRFDDLVFLSLAEHTRDVRELAFRLKRSLPTVYERLKRLGIKPRELGNTKVVEDAKQKARDELAPHRPFIRAILKDLRES